ncbi:TetR family transcriptional regulator [Actinophytocola sp.]|uniref:TetR family transcriptional regulator n=1 Tax=Actinophytocola sp. TaxID=1872138 RepID=UPI002ECFD013
MRADAARNVDAVLHTGARLLAADPATSIASIAAAAGVDRRTVYRRFATREALITAVFNAKLAAAEQVLDTARLMEAPVAVALHRYVEGAIPSIRLWPVEISPFTTADEHLDARRRAVRAQLDAFVDRAVAEGFFRSDLPRDWIRTILDHTVHLAAQQLPDLPAPQCADLVVNTLMKGIGSVF